MGKQSAAGMAPLCRLSRTFIATQTMVWREGKEQEKGVLAIPDVVR